MTPIDITTVEQGTRLDTANAALALFAVDVTLSRENGHVVVQFPSWHRGKPCVLRRRWQTSGQSFYPTWSRKFSHGGTVTIALAQLVRWVRHQHVLPLSTWRYWCSEKVSLAQYRGAELLNVLEQGGYPEGAACCLCGRDPLPRFDWWHLDGVSGPCCDYGDSEGCRQKPKVSP